MAMDNPHRRFWLDVDAICLWLNMSKIGLNRIVREHKIPTKNGLYDIAAITKVRNYL